MAEEAERLAAIVSYARDKARLHEQARSWREKALELQSCPAEPVMTAGDARGVRAWLRRRHA